MNKKEFGKFLEEIKASDRVPTLLLHSCCAPCSSYVIEYLSKVFKITVFYYNPNISPSEEYAKRAKEQQRFLGEFKAENKIDFIEGDYDEKLFEQLCIGLEKEAEGGKRCEKCYELRLRKTAELAKELKLDYFATTLSVSPYKNAAKLNETGLRISRELDINYLVSDFKKNNGYKRSIELSKEYGLYRQDYCGCKYSKRN